jgi:hypothetical protein
MLRRTLVSIALALAFASSPAKAGVTYFAFDSSPTSWVGKGRTDFLILPNGEWGFQAVEYSDTGSLHPTHISIQNTKNSFLDWNLYFADSTSSKLQVGLYSDAVRWPGWPQDLNSLTVTGGGQGDNMSLGVFNVLEVEYDPKGLVTRFAADFTHYGETDPANWLVGRIRFNATVPEPSTLALAGISAVALLAHGVRRRFVA